MITSLIAVLHSMRVIVMAGSLAAAADSASALAHVAAISHMSISRLIHQSLSVMMALSCSATSRLQLAVAVSITIHTASVMTISS